MQMIVGTGIDLIEVERVATRVGRDSGFRELVFSSHEIRYCEAKANPAEHFAGRFAAKEAFLKALGTGWADGLSLNEIEVMNESNGKPFIRLSGEAEKIRALRQIQHIHLSLSHLKTMATAIVILES